MNLIQGFVLHILKKLISLWETMYIFWVYFMIFSVSSATINAIQPFNRGDPCCECPLNRNVCENNLCVASAGM